MRKGTNPAKLENNKVENDCFHQVIVPVYLPVLEGYYVEGLEILKLCLESIYLTVHDKTYISVINNGSCQEVRAYLDDLVEHQKIQEVIHTMAIGKINAIAKGLSGHDFDLVTITDADVLFTNGWQKAVYEIYETFPKAGMVCATPQSKRLRYLTENIFFDYLMNSKLKFREVKNPEAMQEFAKSIDNENLFNDIHLQKILSIKKNNTIAVIGAGHFSATYRKSLLREVKISHSKEKISSTADRGKIDIPSIKSGHWRLSTYDNFTYHLGNTVLPWMRDLAINNKETQLEKPKLSVFRKGSFVKIKRNLVQKLLFNKYVWNRYLVKCGLTESQSKKY